MMLLLLTLLVSEDDPPFVCLLVLTLDCLFRLHWPFEYEGDNV